jgi:cell division protein FtsI (penicillin-binding protein 3)
VFEPGSVNKVITLSAALEEGLFRPQSVLRVPDALPVSTHVYRDHDPHPPTDWTVSDILVNSSNTGTILIAKRLGKERIDAYLRAFGFGRPTGVGFPGESSGLLLDPDEWVGTSIGSVPIGNGLAVTAVQMLGAYNVIANDGVYVAPKLVRATIDGEGRSHPGPTSAPRRVVSSQTAEQLRAMLAEAVSSGTGTEAAVDAYTVAGKTGTARKPSLTHRGYEPGAYMSSFAGFLPAEDPRLSVIVVLDEPVPIFGGVVAAPVFSQLAAYALRQYRIPPAPADLPDVPEPRGPGTTLCSRNELPTP